MSQAGPEVLLDASRGRWRYRIVLLTAVAATLGLTPVLRDLRA